MFCTMYELVVRIIASQFGSFTRDSLKDEIGRCLQNDPDFRCRKPHGRVKMCKDAVETLDGILDTDRMNGMLEYLGDGKYRNAVFDSYEETGCQTTAGNQISITISARSLSNSQCSVSTEGRSTRKT